mgnify:CR=1 FL=1
MTPRADDVVVLRLEEAGLDSLRKLEQMGVDAAIVLASIFVVAPDKVALSVLGAVALNFVIAVNHRTDRYFGV